MKHLFIFAFLLSSCSLFAQNYKPMAVEGATWVYASYYYSNATYFGHQIKGDSTINGTDYKVIYGLSVDRDDNDSIAYEIVENYPLAFVRDDLEERTVHIIYTEFAATPEYINCQSYDWDTIQEYTIYDFGVEVGGYDEGCDASSSDPLMNISSIDTFGYEVLEFTYQEYQGIVLEQIGSLGGFFLPRFPIFTAAGGMELISYCINDEAGCPYYLGPLSSEDITKNDQVTVFPNPSNSYFNIESEEDRIQSITIYTLTGQRVYSRSEINNTAVDIDISDISVSGNLFAIIELEDGKVTRKHLVVE